MPSRTTRDEQDLDDPNESPPEINPYTVLSIPQNADADQIKSAYRRAALRYHPDKAPPADKEEAHTKFQEIAFAYAILSDERRRKRYDTTGNTSETLDLEDDDFNWTDFYREQFANVVTEDSINKFANEYKGSEEERQHVLKAYGNRKGAMASIYQEIMLSDMLDDEERFRAIIDRAIEDGEVEAYKKYTDETEKARAKRMEQARKKKERDAKEAQKAIEESTDPKKKGRKGDGGMGDLAALIQQRQKGRAANFLDGLEAKYAGDAGGKGKKSAKRAAAMDEPPEEAFARNRKAGKGEEAVTTADSRQSKRSKKV
ncbi:hypothetical protein BAUCODRAFT_32535 [Baudoinia panamericana UAMH 10762]|uniref:J domain-containing protein n=1 Tax=Baudoinia panamericana (strain UAMH 10762) TaxID=717646 RepID=M2N3F9_BAUPA|nr:uncharacterized protein BAUCODRAFT_32535 [Baudoinia panamericana UAMH 10762]EMC98488.1 hypothetical protein BAUCODRAFT_32535 [Baudoinia panamericana UAMH 10762]